MPLKAHKMFSKSKMARCFHLPSATHRHSFAFATNLTFVWSSQASRVAIMHGTIVCFILKPKCLEWPDHSPAVTPNILKSYNAVNGLEWIDDTTWSSHPIENTSNREISKQTSFLAVSCCWGQLPICKQSKQASNYHNTLGFCFSAQV